MGSARQLIRPPAPQRAGLLHRGERRHQLRRPPCRPARRQLPQAGSRGQGQRLARPRRAGRKDDHLHHPRPRQRGVPRLVRAAHRAFPGPVPWLILGGMRRSEPVDGFRLAYDRAGSGPAAVLLHGWPGDRTDYRAVVPRVTAAVEAVVPDLRGFGESDRPPAEPGSQYTAAAQARGIVALIEELGLVRPVLAGYDIGSRIAQAVARERPDLVKALVVSPPLPGIGD